MWTIRVKEEEEKPEQPPEEKPPEEEKPEFPQFPEIDFSKLMPLLIAGAFIGLVLYALKD